MQSTNVDCWYSGAIQVIL